MVYRDLVQETTTTTGTGNITLAGAVTGYQSFNGAVGVGPSFEYCIKGGSEYETGLGHLSGSSTLVRDVVYTSSNTNALVSFSAGTKTVSLEVLSETLNKVPTLGQVLAAFGANP